MSCEVTLMSTGALKLFSNELINECLSKLQGLGPHTQREHDPCLIKTLTCIIIVTVTSTLRAGG